MVPDPLTDTSRWTSTTAGRQIAESLAAANPLADQREVLSRYWRVREVLEHASRENLCDKGMPFPQTHGEIADWVLAMDLDELESGGGRANLPKQGRNADFIAAALAAADLTLTYRRLPK